MVVNTFNCVKWFHVDIISQLQTVDIILQTVTCNLLELPNLNIRR